jgi:ArsR family transcriptional regulator
MNAPEEKIRHTRRAKMFKALGDPNRVQIINLLAKHGSMCGTELSEELGISLALVSHHWKVLAQAGLVSIGQHGQHKFCSIEPDAMQELMAFCACDGKQNQGKAAAKKRAAR